MAQFNPRKHVVKPIKNGKRSKIFWVDFYTEQGDRIQRSLKTKCRPEAEKLGREIYDKYYHAPKNAIKADMETTLSGLIDIYFEYKSGLRLTTLATYRCHAISIIKHFDKKLMARDMNKPLAERYKKAMEKSGLAPDTMYNNLKFLKCLYSWAHESELLVNNPLATMKLPPRKHIVIKYFSRDEYDLIFENVSSLYYGPILTSFQTGMRKTEVCSMRWTWVDFENNEIHLPAKDGTFQSKTGKSRDIPMTDQVKEYLHKLRKFSLHPDAGYVFSRDRGATRFRDPQDSYFRHFLKRLKLTGRDWHSMRHTFATWFLEMYPGQFEQLMRIGGWTNLSIVLRYAHDTDKQVQDRHQKVNSLFKNASSTPPTSNIKLLKAG